MENDIKMPENINCLEFLLRILFIYQKLEQGWTVKKKEDENHTFEFTREVNNNS